MSLKKIINKIKTFNVKKYIENNIMFLIYVITSVINGMLLRFLTVQNFFDLRPIIADITVILIIGSFGYLMKPKNRFKYFLVLSFLESIICVINSMYYTNYLSFSSLSLLATSMQVVDVKDAVVENVMEIKDFCYLWQVFAVVFAHVTLKKHKHYEKLTNNSSKNYFINTIIASLILAGVFITTLSSTDIGRIGKQWNRQYIVMKYGIYTYQISDAIASISPKISSMFGYDKNAKIFREYYASKEQNTDSNEYTGIFKDKNVIVIHAESLQQFTLNVKLNDKELTPNLNKLASEGMYFSNFYAQESVGTSSDSEFTFNTSLMPATRGTVFINYWDRDYVTIPKLMKKQGYYTFSMHGNNCSFWNRNVVHQAFGYDKFYCSSKDFKIDETIGLGLSDKSFFHQVVSKLKTIKNKNEKYYGTLITLTNHSPFSDINNYSNYDVTYKTTKFNPKTGKKEQVSNSYLEGTVLGNYFKSVNYSDSAIGNFVKELEKEGLLDNTVLVIYGDHDAKIKKSEYEYYYNYDPKTNEKLDKNDPKYKEIDSYDYELNRKVPFIIWTKDHEFNLEIKKVMGMYDVLPTLGNMLGISSDYSLGHDIFSTDENVVVFPDGDWVTDKMYYSSQNGEGKLLNKDYSVSAEYIEKYCKYSEDLISVSNAIITYDLIRETNETLDLLKKG